MEPKTAMDAIVISAAVVALVQLVKWSNVIPDKFGPFAVLFFSAAGVALYGYSHEMPFAGTFVWEYFTGWINVSLAAAGIFGFTRATHDAVTNMKSPPADGAGSSRTV